MAPNSKTVAELKITFSMANAKEHSPFTDLVLSFLDNFERQLKHYDMVEQSGGDIPQDLKDALAENDKVLADIIARYSRNTEADAASQWDFFAHLLVKSIIPVHGIFVGMRLGLSPDALQKLLPSVNVKVGFSLECSMSKDTKGVYGITWNWGLSSFLYSLANFYAANSTLSLHGRLGIYQADRTDDFGRLLSFMEYFANGVRPANGLPAEQPLDPKRALYAFELLTYAMAFSLGHEFAHFIISESKTGVPELEYCKQLTSSLPETHMKGRKNSKWRQLWAEEFAADILGVWLSRGYWFDRNRALIDMDSLNKGTIPDWAKIELEVVMAGAMMGIAGQNLWEQYQSSKGGNQFPSLSHPAAIMRLAVAISRAAGAEGVNSVAAAQSYHHLLQESARIAKIKMMSYEDFIEIFFSGWERGPKKA